MSKLAITQNNGTVIAELAFPDSAIPGIRRVYGGANNAQTAAAVLADLADHLRAKVLEGVVSQRRNVDMAAISTGETAERTDFDANVWPVT